MVPFEAFFNLLTDVVKIIEGYPFPVRFLFFLSSSSGFSLGSFG